MKKRKNEEEYEIKWWKDWLEADLLEKEKMVEKLPIVNEMCDFIHWKKIPNKIRIHLLVITLNGFFEDLESAMYTKMRNEKKR